MDGLKIKYHITKADGTPVDEQGVYFVLKLNSDNNAHASACIAGARAYAEAIKDTLPRLAEDLLWKCKEIACGMALSNYHERMHPSR